MNRIYQGRISRVEISTDDKNNPWRSFDPNLEIARKQWETALWQHHEFFQDAINYYILALVSLADPKFTTNRLIQDLQAQVRHAWVTFPKSVRGEARSFGRSVANWLKLSSDASIEDAFKGILNGNESTPQVRTLALALLLERCSGEAAIQQGGRGYLPRFCDSQTNPTYDFSATSQAAGVGKNRLSQALHGEVNENDLLKIAGEMDIAWTIKLQPNQFYTPEDSFHRLAEAVEHVRNLLRNSPINRIKEITNQFPDFEKQLDLFKIQIEKKSQQFVVPRNRKASKDLTFATLLFKFFPSLFTAKVLSLFVKKVKLTAIEKVENKVDFYSCGDDPIKLARGERGFVFRAFTALPAWNPKSSGEPVWKEFDIAAFKEALKSLNQFNQKTQERIDEENNLRGQLAIMLGSEIKGWKLRKTEADEDEPMPEQFDAKLFQLARELEHDLTQDLADTVPGEKKSIKFGEAIFNYRDAEWQISSASLRGFNDIAEEWNALYVKQGKALTTGQLEEIVKKYQRDEKNKKSMGSVPLFLRLCKEKYWPLWLMAEELSNESLSEKPFLESMVVFHSKFRDLERSEEPINLTPAEPKHSRRLYMFSDLKDKLAKVKLGKVDDGFTVDCAIATKLSSGSIKEQKIRLIYSAKRLLRDELQGGVGSQWLQPMTRALGLEVPRVGSQIKFDSAVSLMPDFSRSVGKTGELRFLLNFPVSLDPSWIHSSLGKVALWKGQFNGTRDKNLHLHWPATVKGKASESPWWKNDHVIKHGFSCISVDLGQRITGAWALLRVTCIDPRTQKTGTKRPVRKIGDDGERVWFAEVLSTGILRLPGEDQKIMDPNGNIVVERFGKSGRNALECEWNEGRRLASDLLAENPEAWVGKHFNEKSFPEQNDGLIALANRRLSRLSTFHRWSCFNPDRPEIISQRSDLIEKLIDELEHWKDPEVMTWKKLIEDKDFASFRVVAGEAFDALRFKLSKNLEMIANRVAPLRDRSWRWEAARKDAEQGIYGELLDTGISLTQESTWIRGQRGLSLSRIEQLEKLRRLFLRYNRSFDRQAQTPAKFGRSDLGRRSGEPCSLLLEKIERIKDQRINQTAHLILAQALGVRLRAHQINKHEREARDIHGEYEKIPGREPVDFIVIENLDRYLTSQGRAPSENSRLMKWAHRAVRDKIKMLAEEPFGIPLVETAAAYSSKFCALTGVAGARCEEMAKLSEYARESFEKISKRLPKPGQPDSGIFAVLLQQFNQLEELNKLRHSRNQEKKKKPLHTLFAPNSSGPLFLSAIADKSGANIGIPRQADINAAINIGLRAVAAPNMFDILHKVRAEKENDYYKPVIKNAREKAAFDAKAKIVVDDGASNKLTSSRNPNFFFNAKTFNCFDSATLKLTAQTVPLVSGIGLWATVNQIFPRQLIELNKQRLERWQRMPASQDDLPM